MIAINVKSIIAPFGVEPPKPQTEAVRADMGASNSWAESSVYSTLSQLDQFDIGAAMVPLVTASVISAGLKFIAVWGPVRQLSVA